MHNEAEIGALIKRKWVHCFIGKHALFKRNIQISRAGSYFKPVLVQIANALVKSNKNPEFSTRYKRIKARRGHKKAIIAICRMILTAIWQIGRAHV